MSPAMIHYQREDKLAISFRLFSQVITKFIVGSFVESSNIGGCESGHAPGWRRHATLARRRVIKINQHYSCKTSQVAAVAVQEDGLLGTLSPAPSDGI